MIHHSKILVLVGPTASGKSELAVQLAKKFNGEIISADSRQVYRGLNLGTGKVAGKWQSVKKFGFAESNSGYSGRIFVYKSIPHHLIDIINPRRQYSAALFKKKAEKALKNIFKRGKLPILCGGTAHWIDAVIFNQNIPEARPNSKLRTRLEKKSTEDLYLQLKKLDAVRAETIDRNNRRRLVRALEIVITTGKPVPPLSVIQDSSQIRRDLGEERYLESNTYNTLWLGIKTNQVSLYKKIDQRLSTRLEDGMVNEVKKLHKQGLSWKRLESFGLEYRFIAQYLQKYQYNSLPLRGRAREGWNKMLTELSYSIKHYSKRQLTWWKKNKSIHWIKPDIKTASKLVSNFLKKSAAQ